MELKDVDTKGKFEYCIKPGVEHPLAVINRAVEEIQKIIVANKDSAKETMNIFQNIQDRITKLEEQNKKGFTPKAEGA